MTELTFQLQSFAKQKKAEFDTHKEFETLSQSLLFYEEKFSNDLSLLVTSFKSSEAKIQTSKEKIAQLKTVLNKNMQENMKKEKILEERNYKLQELKATYEEINSEANDIIHKKETMEKDLQKIMEQISEEKETISKQEKNIKGKLTELDKARNWFRDTLGLQFKKTSNNTVQMIFKFINHRKPNKLYMFFIKVEDNGQYSIPGCNPSVPNLDELVKELNTSNCLSNFILAIRKAFKDLCLQ